MKSVLEKPEFSPTPMLSLDETVNHFKWSIEMRRHIKLFLDKREIVQEVEDNDSGLIKTYALGINSFEEGAISGLFRIYFKELNKALGENIIARKLPEFRYGLCEDGTPQFIISARLATAE